MQFEKGKTGIGAAWAERMSSTRTSDLHLLHAGRLPMVTSSRSITLEENLNGLVNAIAKSRVEL